VRVFDVRESSTTRAIAAVMRLQKLDRRSLAYVIGGADVGQILSAASPLVGMIPGIGPIASAILPMVGSMVNQSKGSQQAAADPSQAAAAQQQAAPDSSGAAAAAAQQGGGGGGGMGRRHHSSVSVSVSTG
jgi:hypothetical protein